VIGSEAIVERLGEDQRYQVVRGGRNFVVNERRYAIFPQQAGALQLGPATYEAMVIPSRGFSRVQRLRSQTVDVEVLPAVPPPPELTGAAWLPAKSLTLTESWADDGGQDFSVGVPRTRVLTIAAEGLLETQLPELKLEQVTGIRQYPDQPELTRELTPEGLKVTRVERYAVIAQGAGEATIPAAEMPWWNVREERWEVARLEAATIVVAPSAQPPPVPTTTRELPAAGEFVTSTSYWPLVSVVLSLAWLATILLWLRARFGVGKRRDAEKQNAHSASRSSRRLTKQLHAACLANDAPRARDLLLEWAKQAFEADPPASLGVLRERLPEPLASEVAALEADLYGREGGPWNGRGLAALTESLDSVKPAPDKGDQDPLVPLYR
jgi:hypothetical protein